MQFNIEIFSICVCVIKLLRNMHLTVAMVRLDVAYEEDEILKVELMTGLYMVKKSKYSSYI